MSRICASLGVLEPIPGDAEGQLSFEGVRRCTWDFVWEETHPPIGGRGFQACRQAGDFSQRLDSGPSWPSCRV